MLADTSAGTSFPSFVKRFGRRRVRVYRSGRHLAHLACRRAGRPARRKWRVVREGACDLAPTAGRQEDAALYGGQDGRRYTQLLSTVNIYGTAAPLLPGGSGLPRHAWPAEVGLDPGRSWASNPEKKAGILRCPPTQTTKQTSSLPVGTDRRGRASRPATTLREQHHSDSKGFTTVQKYFLNVSVAEILSKF